jgi:hypothetical protein
MKEEDIRAKSTKELPELLMDLIAPNKVDPKVKFYPGRVETNNDPEKLGRCQIRVFGIYKDSIQTIDLPFSTPDFNFIGSNLGSFVVPPVGAIVRVYFENDDMYRPFYTTKVTDTNNLSDERLEDYPDSVILFETDMGEMFKLNRRTAETLYRHPSGMFIRIDQKGNVFIESNETENGDLNLTFKGDINIKAGKSLNLEAGTGFVNLGKNASVSVPNIQLDPPTGAPTTLGKQIPGTPGSVRLPL